MKYFTPLRLSLLTSVYISLAFSVVYFVVSLIMFGQVFWSIYLIVLSVLFLFSFMLFKYILDKFIYSRIKLIYKTIHDLKAPRRQEKTSLLANEDLLGKANQEVQEWFSDKKQEIENLKKLETYRREFLGNVSHELKTPVFNIQGYILTLLDGGLDDPAINRKYLLRSEKSVNRMISIIEDLESIARLESGELKMVYSNFDVVSLSREVMEFMEIKAEKKSIEALMQDQGLDLEQSCLDSAWIKEITDLTPEA